MASDGYLLPRMEPSTGNFVLPENLLKVVELVLSCTKPEQKKSV